MTPNTEIRIWPTTQNTLGSCANEMLRKETKAKTRVHCLSGVPSVRHMSKSINKVFSVAQNCQQTNTTCKLHGAHICVYVINVHIY